MAWFRCIGGNGGSSGGGVVADKLIDYELYSHPRAFDSIPLPANYSDYDWLYLAIVQEDVDLDDFDVDMPFLRGCKVIPVSAITSSDVRWDGTPIYDSSFVAISSSWLYVNSSRILGGDYPLSWQNLYLVCYGLKKV